MLIYKRQQTKEINQLQCYRVMRKLILHKQSHKRQVSFDKVFTTHWHYPIQFPSTRNERWSANFFPDTFRSVRSVGATINTTKHQYKSLLGCVFSRKSLSVPISACCTTASEGVTQTAKKLLLINSKQWCSCVFCLSSCSLAPLFSFDISTSSSELLAYSEELKGNGSEP